MKNTGKKFITTAALSGLLAGVAINQGCSGTDSGASNPAAGRQAPLAKNPSVHDCAGENDCKGIGGCKTDEHACKFKNSCKGKGGCHLTAKDIQDWEKQNGGKSKDTTSKST